MTPVSPLRNKATLEYRQELLINIQINQMATILAYQRAKQTWNPFKRYKLFKEAKSMHARVDRILEEYRDVFKQ